MSSDQLAFWGFVIAAITLGVTVVGAAAAIMAVVYARGGATQKSLELVEANTAQTAEQVLAVKGHMAQVDDHLRIQNSRESLDIAARAVSITAIGDGWNDEDQKFFFTVRTPGVSISHIDMISGSEMMSGNAQCVETSPGTFSCTVSPQSFAKWLNSGDPLPPDGERKVIHIRAGLRLDGAQRHKVFSVVTSMQMRARPGGMTYYYATSGQC